MRSLHLLSSSHRRGAEVFACELATSLTASGDPADVVALAPAPTGAVQLPIDALARERRSVRGFLALRRLSREYDVVVAHGSSTLEACAVALGPSGPPFVYKSIGDTEYWVRTPRQRATVGWMLRRASRVVVLWDGAADVVSRRYDVRRRSIDVVPNGVALSGYPPLGCGDRERARRSLGLAPSGRVIAYVGALSPEKNVDQVVEAARRSPITTTLVAGDGPLRRELERDSRSGGMPDIRFLGTVESPRDLYLAADLLLLPSQSEGMPGVIIQAGLCGTPTLATAVGAVPEMIEEGRTGFLIDLPELPRFAARVGEVVDRTDELRRDVRTEFAARFDLTLATGRWRTTLERAIVAG